MKRAISVLLGVIMAMQMLCACGQKASAWQEQYDLGVRYLSEGNYEEAIIAFTAAIDIDSKQVDVYARLAEAYLGVGDVETARQVLQTGFEVTGSEILRLILDDLSSTTELTPEAAPTPRDELSAEEETMQSSIEDFEIVNGVLIKFVGSERSVHVVIPDSVVSIGDEAFSRCYNVASVVIPKNVVSIGDRAFEKCNQLASVTIHDGVTSIGEGAFYECVSLTEVIIPNSVTDIGQRVFYGCHGLTSVQMSNNITSINAWTFDGCSELTNIEIPDGVTSIGRCAFAGCYSLINVDIPSSVTSIGDQVFIYCRGLTSISIPVGVTNIKFRTFGECQSLSDVYYSGSSEEWAAIQIDEANEALQTAVIHYNSTEY